MRGFMVVAYPKHGRVMAAGGLALLLVAPTSTALAAEAASFGVKVTVVQPGGYWTDPYTSMASTTPAEPYAPLRAELERQWDDG